MADQASGRDLLLPGGLAVAMGIFVMLMVSGIIPSKGGAAHAPLWVGLCGGGVFVLAGAALLLRALAGGKADDGELPAGSPFWLRLPYYLIGLAVVGALAAVGTWVAFGPGARAFTMTVPFLGRGPGNEWIGRAVFGFGAVLTWLFFITAAITWGRKFIWRKNA